MTDPTDLQLSALATQRLKDESALTQMVNREESLNTQPAP